MSRRDGKARMPWSVKGVSTGARDLAKSATTRDGETMGEWLSDVIRRVGAAEAAGRPLGPPHRRGLPTLPGRRPGGEPQALGARHAAARIAAERTAADRDASVPDLAVQSQAARHAEAVQAESVDEQALAELVAERLERTETRLVGLLGSLEDVVLRLTDRLDRLERSLADDPADAHPDRDDQDRDDQDRDDPDQGHEDRAHEDRAGRLSLPPY